MHRARPPAALARIISPLKPYYTLSQSGVLSLRPAETVTHPRTLPPLMDCAGVLAAGSRDPLSKGTVTGSTARARERGQHHWQSLPISLISPSIVDGWDGRGLNGLDGRQGCTDARLSLPDEAACVRSRGHTPNVPISLISISLRQLWMGWTEWIGLEVWMHRRQRASFYTYRRAACVRACVRSREGPAEPCGLTSVRPSVRGCAQRLELKLQSLRVLLTLTYQRAHMPNVRVLLPAARHGPTLREQGASKQHLPCFPVLRAAC